MPPRTRSASKPATRSSTRPKSSPIEATTAAKKPTPKAKQASKSLSLIYRSPLELTFTLGRAAPKPKKPEAKSQGKHARQESVDSEAVLVVKAPKRAKASAKLEIFMDMPIEVFIEIAKYLHPLELVLLSRVNKLFRELFMSRRTAPVWVSALSNVAKLPPCPKSLCEPQYAALLFTKTCSTCGQSAPRDLDPFLLVRLCNKCRDKQAVDTSRVTDNTLVFSSRDLVPGKHAGVWWCLLDDAMAVKAKLNEFAAATDPSVGDSWIEARRQEVRQRDQAGVILKAWLQMQDKLREDELNAPKDARQKEIESRLMKLGWEREDFDTFDQERKNQWLSWVHVATPLDAREWKELLPCLLEYVKLNREQRLKREVGRRAAGRQFRFLDWLSVTGKELDPFARAIPKILPAGSSPEEFQCGPHQILRQAFPNNYCRSTSYGPRIDELVMKLDISPDELVATLDDEFESFLASIADWQATMETQLLQMIPEDTVAPKFSDNPDFDIIIGSDDHTKPISELPADQRKLIRADIVFATFSTPVRFYPEDFINWDGMPPETRYNADASGIAKALLNTLGRPNAFFLELKAMGDVFQCGRCHTLPEYMSWKKMIEHYIGEGYEWKRISESRSFRAAKNFTFVYTHDVEATDLTKPLVRVVADSDKIQPVRTNTMKCIQCARIRITQRYYDEHIIEHIRDVHQIEDPEEGQHYQIV